MLARTTAAVTFDNRRCGRVKTKKTIWLFFIDLSIGYEKRRAQDRVMMYRCKYVVIIRYYVHTYIYA